MEYVNEVKCEVDRGLCGTSPVIETANNESIHDAIKRAETRQEELRKETAYNDSRLAKLTAVETEQRLQMLFMYHSPNEEQQKKYEELRWRARQFAETILRLCPAGADQSAALRKVREAVMTANAAIALNGTS